MEVLPFSKMPADLKYISENDYLFGYLNDLNAKTVIVEDDYIDKDYLIDYSNFYARSFKPYKKNTIRLHFFNYEFTKEYFDDNFHSNKEFQDKIKEFYLGFVVIKPIENNKYNKIIGRTLLKVYPFNAGNGCERHYIKFEHRVSLYGIKLTVESLPYQMQDTIVAACATTAIWTTLAALNSLFGTVKQSPFEITQTSVRFPGYERNFPNTGGLNIFQIKEYFNSIGLEIENISVKKHPDVILDVIKAYNDYQLPIIATIKLEKEKYTAYHAVVISGYRCESTGEITELYLHDDGIGPYCKTFPAKDKHFLYWKNKWIDSGKYDSLQVENLLIPLYPKIRYPFGIIHPVFLKMKNLTDPTKSKHRLFLTEVNKYKEYLLDKSFINKKEILTSSFPKYIWIIRHEQDGIIKSDSVIDATTLSDDPPRRVIYLN
ncbi:MAG TPA: hypothetical protein HA262_05775 [Methanosarcina sp.]|jgi:hypothetical protein|nr:hypothetical protein [Methanosarcina sp.]